MASSNPCRFLSASSHLQCSTKLALVARSSLPQRPKEALQSISIHSHHSRDRSNKLFLNTRPNITCAVHMAAGQPDESQKVNLDYIVGKARKFWDSSPQPVKCFPWNKVAENFACLIFDLVLAVVKCLCVPLLAITSLSEMSYCGHQKKLFLVPLPLFIGIAVAGALKETALELSPLLKNAEVPWHLIAIAIFFTLLKLPGPYYPYWGRIFIPHIANGALLRTLWFAILWYRRPENATKNLPQISANDSQSGPVKI